jgi:excisionase family DNA binding protein
LNIYRIKKERKKTEVKKMDENLKPLTPEQVAEFLQITPRGVRDMLRAQEIKGVKIGREWRILQGDLEGFLKELREKTFPGEDEEAAS